jgi:hypothetical protein
MSLSALVALTHLRINGNELRTNVQEVTIFIWYPYSVLRLAVE